MAARRGWSWQQLAGRGKAGGTDAADDHTYAEANVRPEGLELLANLEGQLSGRAGARQGRRVSARPERLAWRVEWTAAASSL